MPTLPASPPAGSPTVEVSTVLASGREAVWDVIATPEGINNELGPWMRMSVPADLALTPETVPIGERMFRSWVFLFGVIPFDYDDLTLVEFELGHRFLERSPMLSAKLWEHERTLVDEAGGCRVTDRVRFIPRVRFAAPLQRRIVSAIFHHRHRRLVQRFGAV